MKLALPLRHIVGGFPCLQCAEQRAAPARSSSAQLPRSGSPRPVAACDAVLLAFVLRMRSCAGAFPANPARLGQPGQSPFRTPVPYARSALLPSGERLDSTQRPSSRFCTLRLCTRTLLPRSLVLVRLAVRCCSHPDAHARKLDTLTGLCLAGSPCPPRPLGHADQASDVRPQAHAACHASVPACQRSARMRALERKNSGPSRNPRSTHARSAQSARFLYLEEHRSTTGTAAAPAC